MSPSRWQQVIPAACMNVASPRSPATSVSQVARSRLVSSAGQAGAAGQRPGQRVADVVPSRVGAAGDQLLAGERGGGQQRGVVAGQHRRGARPAAAADGHDDAAGPADDVAAAHAAEVGADQPGPGPQADQRGSARPPRHRRLSIREREIAADLRGRIRGLRALAGQRRVGRDQLRHNGTRQEPQVRAQRPAGRPRQPRRVRGEPLDHRRVQQHPRRRLQAQPDAVPGELPGRPQQVLGPVPAGRAGCGHDLPGERRRLRRHRRRPPAADVAGDAVCCRHERSRIRRCPQ